MDFDNDIMCKYIITTLGIVDIIEIVGTIDELNHVIDSDKVRLIKYRTKENIKSVLGYQIINTQIIEIADYDRFVRMGKIKNIINGNRDT